MSQPVDASRDSSASYLFAPTTACAASASARASFAVGFSAVETSGLFLIPKPMVNLLRIDGHL
jgi:hypothetical protein